MEVVIVSEDQVLYNMEGGGDNAFGVTFRGGKLFEKGGIDSTHGYLLTKLPIRKSYVHILIINIHASRYTSCILQ